MENEIRSPTERNRLRVITKGYLTDKAAEFAQRFKEGKYRAAAFLKDTADAVYIYARYAQILDPRDEEWYHGTEETDGIFPRAQEAVCRARVDGEEVQDEVMERFENLCSLMRSSLRYRLPTETGKAAILIMDEQLEKAREAVKSREKAPRHGR